MEKAIIAAICAVLAGAIYVMFYELWLHPCMQQVNCRQVTTFVMIGDAIMPMTNVVCDCAERAP